MEYRKLLVDGKQQKRSSELALELPVEPDRHHIRVDLDGFPPLLGKGIEGNAAIHDVPVESIFLYELEWYRVSIFSVSMSNRRGGLFFCSHEAMS